METPSFGVPLAAEARKLTVMVLPDKRRASSRRWKTTLFAAAPALPVKLLYRHHTAASSPIAARFASVSPTIDTLTVSRARLIPQRSAVKLPFAVHGPAPRC